MKTRSGFVSNSSSCSFVLLVQEKMPKNSFSLLDVLKLTFSRNLVIQSIKDGAIEFKEKDKVKEYEGDLKIQDASLVNLDDNWKVEMVVEDIKRLEGEIKITTEVLGKDDSTILLVASQVAWNKPKNIVDAKKGIEEKLKRYQEQLTTAQKRLKDVNAKIALCKKHKKVKGLKFVTFTADNWGLSDVVEMIKKSGAIVVDKVQT